MNETHVDKSKQSPIEQIKNLADQAKMEMLENDVRRLTTALEFYERERSRFIHNHPEITGAFFLTGGHGEKDDNFLPEFVTICPAYGAGWEQVYQKIDRIVSYEGS